MKGDFKTLLRKFCLESSILGLKYFYLYPDPISRCFWAVSIALSLFMACILTILLYNRFADMPTRIAIENQYALIRNVSYPAITICSPNQITVTALEHFQRTLVEGNITVNLRTSLPKLLGLYQFFGDQRTVELNELHNLITLNRYNALQVMGMMPQSCDEFLKLCYLKRKRYPKCAGLFRPILTKHGMCCIFNSVYQYNDKKRNEKVTGSFVPHTASNGGMGEALTVVTDYNPDNALSGSLLMAGAVRIMFTEPSEFPADDESNLVYAYSEAFHSIHATYTYCSEEVTTLPYWSRQCFYEDESYLPYFRQYRNSDCDLLCYVRAIEGLCRCTMIYLPHLKMSRACDITSIDCIVQATLEINKWHHTEQCLCLRDCVSFRYHVDVSIGNLKAFPNMVHNRYSDINFNKSTSILHFFFRDSVYAKQKQETVISLISLSSNLGGVFGLCLGCSVISVLEVIFFIYIAVRNKIKDHCQSLRDRKNKIDCIRKERLNKDKMIISKNSQSNIFYIKPIGLK